MGLQAMIHSNNAWQIAQNLIKKEYWKMDVVKFVLKHNPRQKILRGFESAM